MVHKGTENVEGGGRHWNWIKEARCPFLLAMAGYSRLA